MPSFAPVLRDAHDRIRPALARRDRGFRWRGTDVSRIEGLSDAVFGFALTLLVISLEVPKRFVELQVRMQGFVGFAVCFVMLMLIWHTQYIYFRRYALDDRVSFLLNAALLFVVAFYIYPLKFLATTFINALIGYHELDAAGQVIVPMRHEDWRPLMLIYSAGFVALYGIFTLLYLHAYRQRAELQLNSLEIHETRGAVWENAIMLGIGTLSLALAAANLPIWAGVIYMLIGPAQTLRGRTHGRQRQLLRVAD
jgi:uncharacterized membrane protein